MINPSKLKNYNALCEIGVLTDSEHESIDSLISEIEEKQFEYLKRLETTTDEERKDDLNSKLVIIELQLKELALLRHPLILE